MNEMQPDSNIMKKLSDSIKRWEQDYIINIKSLHDGQCITLKERPLIQLTKNLRKIILYISNRKNFYSISSYESHLDSQQKKILEINVIGNNSLDSIEKDIEKIIYNFKSDHFYPRYPF